jgi:hypothetical protein
VTLRFAVQDAWQLEQFWQSIIHSARGADCAPEKLSGAEIERWLVHDASKQRELLLAYEEFAWRMVAAGLPMDQSGLYIGTLHPLLRGFAWTWRRSDASCDELKVKEGVIGTESARVVRYGSSFQLDNPCVVARKMFRFNPSFPLWPSMP